MGTYQLGLLASAPVAEHPELVSPRVWAALETRTAACLVPSSTRADINGLVKRRLDVRKASFLAREAAVDETGMEFGGITPIGLPAGWPILVDSSIQHTPLVIIGSGIRKSKLLVPGDLFAQLPGAEIIDELGRLIPVEE
jgi:prolyl-tRNA editing enzyme YbaK/EbsC (Cys-tRNA(Pro) deacylase)